MVQPQLVPVRRGDGRAVRKTEGLGQVQIFLDGGQVEALFAKGGALLQNAGDPAGKAGEGRKVEQELAGRQPVGKGQPDEIGVGDAVAGQTEQRVHRAGTGVDPLPPVDEGVIKPQGALVDIGQPGAQTEDADVFRQLDGLGLLGDVVDLFLVSGFFFPVAVAPAVDPPADKETRRRGGGHQRDQRKVQPRKESQIDRKTGQVEQKAGQGGPDVLGRAGVGTGGVLGFLEEFERFGVPGVGVGGGAGFFVQIVDDGDAQPHPAEHGVLVDVAQQAVEKNERQRKAGDGPQQAGQGSVGLHLRQNHRRDEQLRQVDAQRKGRKEDAQGQHVLALAPGQRQHESDVLPDVVLWFGFHMWFTSFRG